MVGFYGGSPLEYAGLAEQGSDAVPASTGEVLGAQFGSAMAANLTPRLFRATERGATTSEALPENRPPQMFPGEYVAPEPSLDAAALNHKYGIPGHLNFDQALPESAARDLYEHKRDELVRQDVIARREGGIATGTVARMGTGLIAGLLDPINLAAGLVPVVGETRVAGLLGRGAVEAMGAAERAGVRAVAGAASGAAAMTALQPLEFGLSRSEREDFTMADALRNVAFGAVLGGGLHVVGGAIADRVTGRYANPITQRIEEQTPEVRQEVLQGALAQHVTDEPVNVAPALDLADAVRAEQELRPGGRIPSPPAPEMAEKPIGFTTAKGSTYEVHEDGTTTRDKSFHPEHGAADQGLQPRSEATFYVDEAGTHKLGEVQAIGGPARIVAPLGDGRWGVKYTEGKDAGKFEARTVLTPETQPSVGLTPVETLNGGERVHFGNPITELRSAPPTVEALGDIRQRQAGAVSEMAPKPAVADPTEIAANAPTPAGEMALPEIEREIADLEARSGIAQPAEPGAAPRPVGEAPGTFRTTVDINGERTTIEGPVAALERPAELRAADAEMETAQARAAAFERAAKCIIGGG